MRHFIHLTNTVINKWHIIKVIKKPNKYCIHLNHLQIEGFAILGSGGVECQMNVIEICETRDPTDYKKITEWITKII